MSVSTAPGAISPSTSRRERLRNDPAYQAFWLLRIGFTVAPILFGADKFADLLTNWDKYLAPWVNGIVPGIAHQAMYAVGVIEIVAGLCVLIVPRFGGYLVAAWLLGIIVNLLSIGNYYDVALRDFGLLLAALTLARLAKAFPGESLVGASRSA
ncbi:MAG: hypothetical protein ACTHKL_13245 [Streptosporangiaceae bacterium]